LPAGEALDLFTLGYDFLPTLLEAAEIPANDLSFVGTSILGALNGLGGEPVRASPIFWEQKSFSTFWGGYDTLTTLDDEQHKYAVWNDSYNRKLVADRETGTFIKSSLFDTSLLGDETQGEAPELNILDSERNVRRLLEKDYRDWRQTVGLIPNVFDGAATSARVEGLCIDVAGNDEVAQLASNARYQFREGDFSFQARIEFAELPGVNGAVIAEHPQSWTLTAFETPESGMLDIQFDMRARDTRNADFPGTPGDLVSIGGRVACDIPCTMNIAFSLLGITGAETSARLYVDGIPLAEFRGNGKALPPDFMEVYADESSPVLIGNNAHGTAGFSGRIVDPIFYLLSLTPAEVVAVMDAQDDIVCDSGGCH
jgi:hypothetical protein